MTPSLVPQPKVAAAGIAGLITTLLITIAGLAGIEVPAEAAAGLAAFIAFAAGYFKSGKRKTP